MIRFGHERESARGPKCATSPLSGACHRERWLASAQRLRGPQWFGWRACHMSLQLCEGVLDRVEVGTIGRQIKQRRPACLNGAPEAGDLVGGQIVHDDHVARPQSGRQHLFAPSPEGLAVHRPIEQHRRDEAGYGQPADEGHCLPVAVRDRGAVALASRCPAAQACHLGGEPAFVDEDQPLGVEFGLAVGPSLTGGIYIGALLLAGMRSLL